MENLADRRMRFTYRSDSHDRCWSGIGSIIYETSGGFAESSPGAYHCFSMHLSTPIRAKCHFEGKTTARLQVAGDIDFLPVGTCAAWDEEGGATMLGVKLSPSLVLEAADSMGLSADRVSISACLQLRDPRIEHVLWALKVELESRDHLGRVYAESLGTALSSHLVRRYAVPRTVESSNRFSNRRLRRVLDYVRDNLSADLSLFELASVAGLSPTHFKVLFKNSVGLSVHQYIIRQRVEHAVRLIADAKLSLTDIAMQAGFSSPSHMAKLTRQLTGASPAQIRRNL